MASKEKIPAIVTPPGIAKYPKLNKPEIEVNGSPCKPRFVTTLVLDEDKPGVAEFKEQLEKLHAEAIAAAKIAHKTSKSKKPLVENPVTRPHLDEDGNEVEGKFEIRASTQATYEDKKSGEVRNRVVPMYDAKGVPLKDAKIGGGSRLRLSLSTAPYNGNLGAGLSLYLNAVKVLELVEWTGGGSASSHGFGEAEEGYSATESDNFGAGPDEKPADEPAAEEAPAEKTPRKKGEF